jgi:hypothetical protein
MRTYPVTVMLSRPMVEELALAAAEASAGRDAEDGACSPADFATECVEAILATRRLEKIAAS